MTIGEQIKQKRKQERLSAEDLALKLGLKKENIYKWERGSTPSDPEDYKKVQDWLGIMESRPNYLDRLDPYREKYISLLEQQLQYLQDSIKLSLNDLSENITISRAENRAAIEYQVIKDAKGQRERKDAIMEQINKLVAENLVGKRAANSHSAESR